MLTNTRLVWESNPPRNEQAWLYMSFMLQNCTSISLSKNSIYQLCSTSERQEHISLKFPHLSPSHLGIRVGGHVSNLKGTFPNQHPIIIHSNYPVMRLWITRNIFFYSMPVRRCLAVCSIVNFISLVVVRQLNRSYHLSMHFSKTTRSAKGQLPTERVSPDLVFSNVGVDYAGPFCLKLGSVRKPTIMKAYACLFVALSVKAMKIELTLDLTTEALIASLRSLWLAEENQTSFGATMAPILLGLMWAQRAFLMSSPSRRLRRPSQSFVLHRELSGTSYIPEVTPHFRGQWEAAVQSKKTHMFRIVSGNKLTFEELTTLLAHRSLHEEQTSCRSGNRWWWSWGTHA